MKFIKLTNLSTARRAFSGLRDGSGRALVLDPNETKPVHPSVVLQARVKVLLDQGILTTSTPVAPPAPAETKAVYVFEDICFETVPTPKEVVPEDAENAEEVPEPPKEDTDLRTRYLDAPGITEKNVDKVFTSFPTFEILAETSEDALVDAGIRRSFVGRVLEWAKEQL